MRRLLTSLILFLSAAFLASAQESELRQAVLTGDHCFGSYMPYEFVPQEYTPAPKGYTPFYVSHFGRHGSRFHNSETNFKKVSEKYEAAAGQGLLTPMGIEQKALFDAFWEFSKGNIGQLTSVGEAEHAAIAARMVASFPEIFRDGKEKHVLAVSSKIKRVLDSMKAFDESLEAEAPGLKISEKSGKDWQWYVAPSTDEYKEYYKSEPWKELTKEFSSAYDPKGVADSLFTSGKIFKNKKDRQTFAKSLFATATGTKAAGSDVDLFAPFTDDDLFELWKLKNVSQYFSKGPSAYGDGIALSVAVPLLKDIVDKADEVVSHGGRCADLRFGHGEGVMPLAGIMGINGASEETLDPERACEVWQDWRIACLASNIQLIFYRNAKGKVIVRTLLNEREVYYPIASYSGPYYQWKTLKKYFQSRIKEYSR